MAVFIFIAVLWLVLVLISNQPVSKKALTVATGIFLVPFGIVIGIFAAIGFLYLYISIVHLLIS